MALLLYRGLERGKKKNSCKFLFERVFVESECGRGVELRKRTRSHSCVCVGGVGTENRLWWWQLTGLHLSKEVRQAGGSLHPHLPGVAPVFSTLHLKPRNPVLLGKSELLVSPEVRGFLHNNRRKGYPWSGTCFSSLHVHRCYQGPCQMQILPTRSRGGGRC